MHRRERHQIRYASSVRPCPLLYVSNSCVNMPTCVRRWDSGGGTKQVRYRTGQCSADAPDTISLSLQEHGVCMEPRITLTMAVFRCWWCLLLVSNSVMDVGQSSQVRLLVGCLWTMERAFAAWSGQLVSVGGTSSTCRYGRCALFNQLLQLPNFLDGVGRELL